MPEIQQKELSVVLVGNFNPVIITPQWLGDKKFISETEVEEAFKSINYLVHSEVTQFNLSYCNIQTTKERFSITSLQEGYFDTIQKLTVAIFSILQETPIKQLGFNLTHHYSYTDRDTWDKFGDFLAPKAIWSTVLPTPKLRQLAIVSSREGDVAGEINTYIGPSEKYNPGVRIHVNDHYELYTRDQVDAGRDINAIKGLEILHISSQKLQAADAIIKGLISYEWK